MRNIVAATILLVSCPTLIAAPKDSPMVAASKREVIGLMKDPESTRFRNVRAHGPVTVCGEVNSKNSMGGYVGFKRFFIISGDVARIDDGDPSYSTLFEKFCVDAKVTAPAPYHEKSWDDVK